MKTDWSQPLLRAAAVEFALQQCGKRPRCTAEVYAAWLVKLESCAAAFGLTGKNGLPGPAELAEWCRDPALKPEEDYSHLSAAAAPSHRPESEGVEDDAAILEKAFDAIPSPNVPAGALPSLTPDLIASLLEETSPALAREDREEIAAALDAGKDLSAQQRHALAVLLRAAEAASKADVVRAMIDLLIPHGSTLETAWTRSRSRLALHPGEIWEHRECAPAIAGFPLLGRSMLCVLTAEGVLTRAIPYARAAAAGNRSLQYRRLIPCPRFSKELPIKNLCLLADAVRGGTRNGADWGELWGESKQIVSYRRKTLMKKIARLSGARSLMRSPGMRVNPQASKGTTKNRPAA